MAEGFEGLEVWRKAHELVLMIHRQILPRLPAVEKYGLASQLRNSSKSVTANIAEGYGRYYYMDTVRFCYQARGSLFETIGHMIDARDLEYVSVDQYAEVRQLADQVARMLNGYIIYLKKTRQGEREPGAQLAVHEHQLEVESASDEPTSLNDDVPT